jgi:hypothetical protein
MRLLKALAHKVGIKIKIAWAIVRRWGQRE